MHAFATKPALEIHLRLNDVLLDAIQNGLSVIQSESQFRRGIHAVSLDGRHTTHCHTFASDQCLDPHDKLHVGFLRSQEPQPSAGELRLFVSTST